MSVHSPRGRRAATALASIAAFALVATSCGSDGGGASEVDFSGVEITVGSKNFTEQYILSEILLQGLAANGATVTDSTDTGDTAATRAALEDGSIDAYFEYNSTGWVEILEQDDPPDDDGEELTDEVRELDAANGIEWIGRSTFSNTYGFAMSPDVAADHQATRYSVDKFDLQAMADLLDDDDDLTVCVEQEFPDRDDGLVLFEEETDFAIPTDQLRVFDDAAAVYAAFADEQCDFGEVFTTDGEIEALDLEVVVNDEVFYVYNVSLNIRSEVYEQASDDFDDLVKAILSPMSQSRITELNRRVSDGEPVAEVAEDYLRQFNII